MPDEVEVLLGRGQQVAEGLGEDDRELEAEERLRAGQEHPGLFQQEGDGGVQVRLLPLVLVAAVAPVLHASPSPLSPRKPPHPLAGTPRRAGSIGQGRAGGASHIGNGHRMPRACW
jgi:hypothetical protein